MSKHGKVLSKLALSLALPTLVVGGLGCEKEQTKADRRVADNLAQADAISHGLDSTLERQHSGRATTRTADSARAAAQRKAIDAAVNEKDASTAAQAVSLAMLGQAQCGRALDLLPQISSRQEQAASLLADIESLATQIRQNNTDIAALRLFDPNKSAATTRSTQKIYADLKAKYQAQITAAETQIQQIQKDIDAQTKAAEALAAKLKAADTETGELRIQSEQAREPQRSELFTKSVDAKKQATLLAHELKLAKESLDDNGDLKQRLAVAKAQKAEAEQAVQAMDNQASQIATSWTDAQKQIQAIQARSKALLDGPSDSITALAAQLDKLAAQADSQRKQALEQYAAAIASFDKAESLAKQVVQEIGQLLGNPAFGDSPDKAALEKIREDYDEHPYRIRRARALVGHANLYLDLKAQLEAQKQTLTAIAPILQQAGLTPPSQLAKPNLDAQIADATKKATADLQTADQIIDTYTPDSRDKSDTTLRLSSMTRMDARLAAIEVKYDLYRLTGLARHRNTARDMLALLVKNEQGVELPTFAQDLEQGLQLHAKPAAPSPATRSAAKPTTAKAAATPTTPRNPTAAPNRGQNPATPPAARPARPGRPAAR